MEERREERRPKAPQVETSSGRVCGGCREDVKPKATLCPHCGARLTTIEQQRGYERILVAGLYLLGLAGTLGALYTVVVTIASNPVPWQLLPGALGGPIAVVYWGVLARKVGVREFLTSPFAVTFVRPMTYLYGKYGSLGAVGFCIVAFVFQTVLIDFLAPLPILAIAPLLPTVRGFDGQQLAVAAYTGLSWIFQFGLLALLAIAYSKATSRVNAANPTDS